MNITEKTLGKLERSDVRQVYRDDDTPGFGVRVEPKAIGGRISFFWNAKVNNQVLFRALGEWPQTPVKKAREDAEELREKGRVWKRAGYPSGVANPFAKAPKPLRQSATDAPTFSHLVENYVKEHLHNSDAELNDPAKAERNLRWALGKYFKDWMDRPVDTFTIEDVITLKNGAGDSRYMANRLVQYARALFAWCANDENGRVPVWPLSANPAKKVKLSKEKKRKRWLKPEELVALEEALEHEDTPRDLKDFVLLSLDTGARKDNLLGMKWGEIDWDSKQWNIPFSKSGNGYTVDLLDRALQTLRSRHEVRTTSHFVFPGVSAERGYIHMDRPFRRLMTRIGGTLTDVRIHDLRRSCATYQAVAGVPLQQIAHNLGHESMSSVLIYAQMAQEALPKARQDGFAKMQELKTIAKERMAQKNVRPITTVKKKKAGTR